jgi:hypothetical protein
VAPKHLGPREGKSACEVRTVTVLSEQQIISQFNRCMYIIYGLFFSIVPFNSLLELGKGGDFIYDIFVTFFFLFQFLKERIKVYEQNGTTVITEEDPVLAVVIVSPMM